MKRFLLALFIASATLVSFNSCTKEYYTDPATRTFSYTINPNDWTGQGTTVLQTSIDVPELTDHLVDFGLVNLSVNYPGSTAYVKLPATYDGVSYFYEYDRGVVYIFAQDPIDDNLQINISDRLVFKVSLTEGR